MDIKKVKEIVSIIFLGALGSGLWSLAGEPTAGYIYDSISSVGGYIPIKFGNFINSGVGSGGWEDRGSIFFILVFTWAFAYIVTRKMIFAMNNNYLVAIFSVAMFVFTFLFTYKVIHAHKLTLYVNKNIEILAPYADNIEIFKARELYRRIDDIVTFNQSLTYINNLAKKYNIKIQEFSL